LGANEIVRLEMAEPPFHSRGMRGTHSRGVATASGKALCGIPVVLGVRAQTPGEGIGAPVGGEGRSSDIRHSGSGGKGQRFAERLLSPPPRRWGGSGRAGMEAAGWVPARHFPKQTSGKGNIDESGSGLENDDAEKSAAKSFSTKDTGCLDV